MTPDPAAVVTLGETLALFGQAAPGVLRSAAPFEFRVGGAESNVAITLARLGVAVCWMGRVGNDPFGDEVIRALRGEGVEVRVHRDEGRPTGLMVKHRRTSFHQRISYYRAGSAGSALEVADLDLGAVQAARALHVTGVTLAISASAAAAVTYAVDAAREAGVLVSFDLNHRPQLWSSKTAGVALGQLIGRADVVFAGVEEASLVLGRTSEPGSLARQLRERGPREVVLKLGEHGALAVADAAEERAQAVRVPVVDTVGAGDAFVGGYLAALLEDLPLKGRLDLACRVGAFACMSPGDWEGAPSRQDLTLIDAREPVTR